MSHLRSVARRDNRGAGFPFDVPVIRDLARLPFDTPVTLFVGENGSGKSTLLEGIAAAAGLPTIGSVETSADDTLQAQRILGGALKLVWQGSRSRRGFFLRAEDFFGYTKQLSRMRSELQQRARDIDEEYRDRSPHAKSLAMMPVNASLHDMERRYGVDLDANSHGQSFLKLFASRLVPDGLYLLDEPEAPLSPQSQLALLAMITDTVTRGAQFIIATHSPILLAYPAATIYSFDEPPIRTVAYADLAHVTLTRDFLNDPGRYLRHLVAQQEDGGR